MLHLSSISVRSKLVLLVSVPVIALLLAVGVVMLDSLHTARAMRATVSLTQLLGHTSDLALALQAERGTSAGYLSGGDSAPMQGARQKTDQARKRLADYVATTTLPDSVSKNLAAVEAALDDLPGLRTQISSKAVPPLTSFYRYTAWVTGTVQLAQGIAGDTEHAEVMRNEQSLVSLLCVMEQSARERGLLNSVFTSGQFAPASLAKVQAAAGVQQSCEAQFVALADAATLEAYRARTTLPVFAETARLRELAVGKAAEGNFGVDAKQWFATATLRLDALREVRDVQLERIRGTAAASQQSAEAALWWQIGITLVILVLTAVLAWQISHAVADPVKGIEQLMSQLRDSMDLSLRATVTGSDEIARIGHAFNALLAAFNASILEVERCAGDVAGASDALADTAGQVSAATQNQSDSVNGIAASVEQVTVSIATMAAATSDSERKATDAQQSAVRGRAITESATTQMQHVDAAVTQAAETIAQLAQRSAAIDGIVATIREIADQTNLLALNAAIEAARAGETGRGFAVVADEVRKLAERAGSATRDISQLVAAIRADTQAASAAMRASSERMQQGVEGVREVSAALGEIDTDTTGAVGAAREIALAMSEQKNASEMVAQQIEQIAQMTEENSRAVFQTAELAKDLNRLSGQLAGIVGRFHLA
ncbi:methyl-accepting chemotaxis protein [Chitinimonas sp. BJYL2]|uniref:methyl-accepting chemotaxis protein n=1 Tax=Chitinimonas sp. BJYL2 TaxID=2976696 RepID=UPI0022B56EE9|nr:methyl-accepting chemotaxis protein [Chitinimonas sp. BJYL2]